MNYYVAQTIARQRMEEVARNADLAQLRRGVPKTPARWHFPKVSWHLPTLHTAGA